MKLTHGIRRTGALLIACTLLLSCGALAGSAAEFASTPTGTPMPSPTIKATIKPTVKPTIKPGSSSTRDTMSYPTSKPTISPTGSATNCPGVSPTIKATVKPTIKPAGGSTQSATSYPTSKPTISPTGSATNLPGVSPTIKSTVKPTVRPSSSATRTATSCPTSKPTPKPTASPRPTVESTQAPAVRPQSVRIASESGELQVAPKATLQLFAVLLPEGAASEISWKSANKKIATVDKHGLVTARREGVVKIKATTAAKGPRSKKLTASVKIKVVDPLRPTKLSLDAPSVTLVKDAQYAIGCHLKPADTDSGVTYSSSNKRIASVSKSGIVTAKRAGSAVITVKTTRKSPNGKCLSAKLKVTVVKAAPEE